MGAREAAYVAKALALWPRLDRVKLRRTNGDPTRISRLVARRTALPEPAIVQLILGEADAPSGDRPTARVPALPPRRLARVRTAPG